MPPIRVYYLEMWERKYKYNYDGICNNLLSLPLFVLTCDPTPCMSKCVMNVVYKVNDWYVSPLGVYLQIYGSMKELHMFPHYVPDQLVLLETYY